MSVSPELAEALDDLAADRDEDRSSLVEILLREHPLVRRAVQTRRRRDRAGQRDPDLKEAVLSGRVAGRAWESKVESGEVRIRERGD